MLDFKVMSCLTNAGTGKEVVEIKDIDTKKIEYRRLHKLNVNGVFWATFMYQDTWYIVDLMDGGLILGVTRGEFDIEGGQNG